MSSDNSDPYTLTNEFNVKETVRAVRFTVNTRCSDMAKLMSEHLWPRRDWRAKDYSVSTLYVEDKTPSQLTDNRGDPYYGKLLAIPAGSWVYILPQQETPRVLSDTLFRARFTPVLPAEAVMMVTASPADVAPPAPLPKKPKAPWHVYIDPGVDELAQLEDELHAQFGERWRITHHINSDALAIRRLRDDYSLRDQLPIVYPGHYVYYEYREGKVDATLCSTPRAEFENTYDLGA